MSCSSHSDAQLAAFFIDPRAKWSTVECYFTKLQAFLLNRENTVLKGSQPITGWAKNLSKQVKILIQFRQKSLSPNWVKRALYLKAKATGEQRELLEFRHHSTLRSRARQTGQAPRVKPKVCSKHFSLGESQPLMILPQVHLRKPCYDFYFL